MTFYMTIFTIGCYFQTINLELLEIVSRSQVAGDFTAAARGWAASENPIMIKVKLEKGETKQVMEEKSDAVMD